MNNELTAASPRPKSKRKTILISVAVVACLALVTVFMLQDNQKGVDIFAEEVKQRNIVELVSASGRIQPKTKVDIASEIYGEILWVGAREGDRVEQGDLLVILDTVQLRSDVNQGLYAMNEANARLSGAKSRLEQTEDEINRQTSLYDRKLTSETEFTDSRFAYEAARSGFDATKAQAQQSRARYNKLLDNLSKAKIAAPMSGVITYLNAEVGEIAAAQTGFTQGRTLMTISNLDVFEVEVEVDETEIAKVELGQQAEIEVDAFPDTIFTGEVVEIGNTAIFVGAGTQDQSTNFRVKVVFDDSNEKIRPGMSATVDITANQQDGVFSVPFSAVVMRTYDMDSLEAARAGQVTEDDTGGVHAAESTSDTTDKLAMDEEEPEELKGVFVIRDGVARFVEVKTGIANQKHIEIISGLSEQDSVISGPYRVLRTIKDGEAVKLKEMDKDKDK